MHPEAGGGGGNWQRIAPPPSKQTSRATIRMLSKQTRGTICTHGEM